MKRFISSFVLAMAIALTASAQVSYSYFRLKNDSLSSFRPKYNTQKVQGKRIRFGVEVGGNLSDFGGSALKGCDSETRSNPHFGVTISPLLGKFGTCGLWLKTGAYFMIKGADVSFNEKIPDDDLANNLIWNTKEYDYFVGGNGHASSSYVELSVMPTLGITLSDLIELQVGVGVYYAVAVDRECNGELTIYQKLKNIPDCNYKSSLHNALAKGSVFEDIFNYKFNPFNKHAEWLKKSDFGLKIGAGVLFARHGYVGLGYEFSVIGITARGDGNLFNRNLFVSFGYAI